MVESRHGWEAALSFKNATILVSLLNLLLFLFILHGFFAPPNASPSHSHQIDPAQLRYILESEEMRRAMEPLELIKRVKEIQQETFVEPGTAAQQPLKQTTAVDLSNRLKDLRGTSDANNQKALEEWRKRKIERARQREIKKNGTTIS